MCEANHVSTNGMRSPFATVNSATVVKSFPRVSTGVRQDQSIQDRQSLRVRRNAYAVRTHGTMCP